jgi:hypothetical protein
VRFLGQVLGEGVIAQKPSYFGIVDEEYFQFTEVEQLVSVLAMPVAAISLGFGKGTGFILRHEESKLLSPCTAGDGAAFGVDAHDPSSFPPRNIVPQEPYPFTGMGNQGLFC